MDQANFLRDRRHVDKAFYMLVDYRFYEPYDRHYAPSDEFTSLVHEMLHNKSKNWEIQRDGVWSHVQPLSASDKPLPAQGWKIHVSATKTNCLQILRKVAAVAIDNDVPFKFAIDTNTLLLMTSKQWMRGGSGKFITVYPSTDEEFRSIIDRIHDVVRDDCGSYILSDKRYRNCRCLYYRYGGILPTYRLDFMGVLQPILTSPEKEEILDVRTPYFNLPPWTTDPFPQDEEEEEPEMTLDHGRFAIKRALSFSNTGGVYLAVDQTTGKDVVIKEGRPFVEVDRHGQDAISRLKTEAMMLSLINGQGIAPMPIATFSDWENSYFVEEYFDATDLREIMLIHTPVLRVNPSTSDSEGFYAIFKSIFVSLLTGISRIHRLGIVICDMSPVNILVDKTSYAARIIDFEAAYRLGIDDPSEIYTPGFRSLESIRRDIRGYYDDLYAVAVLMVYSMFPIAAISSLRDDLFSNILPIILSDIGWSQTRLLEIITGLATDTMTCDRACELLEMPTAFETPLSTANSRQEATLQDYYSGLAQFLSHSYRTDDHFTLFPSDPFAGRTNAVGLGFGSSGVIYSLRKCGFDVPQPALDRFAREIGEVKAQDLAPGILTGYSGIALVFFGLEDTNQAERFMGYANSSLLLRRHHSLYYGMAGIGMSNLVAYLRTKNTKYLDVAQDLAKTLAENAKEDPNGIYWEDQGLIHLGLGYGQSGVALFFLRLSQVLGISDWRELGRRALSYDLSHGYATEPGVLSFTSTPDDHITYEQYIEEGSAGIAKVAIRYGIWDDIDDILADVHRKYSGFAGLLFGLSGFIDVLVDAYIYSGNAKYLEMAKRPIAGLRDLYLIKQPHGYATPGDNLFRISCDYATGVSGVMRTLYRMAHLTQSDFTLDELDSEARLRDSACIGKPTLQRTSHV